MLSNIRRPKILLSLFLLLCGSAASAYEVGDWTVEPLTDNAGHDRNPVVNGGRIVWNGQAEIPGWQIFLWENGVTTQLTDNSLGHVGARVSDELVAWSTLTQVFSYDGEVHALTPVYEDHDSPEVSGSLVAWLGEGSNGYNQVYLHDGSETVQVTDSTYAKHDLRISGSVVTWWGSPNPSGGDVFYYDGVEVHQLTTTATQDKYPRVSHVAGDLHLTYESYIDGQWDIMHFDGDVITNLSNTPTINEDSHQRWGQRTIWRRYDSGQYSVWLHDGSEATQVSASSTAMSHPQVSESLVVWEGGYYTEIFVSDGTTVTQLTDNYPYSSVRPQVSGDTVVWYGSADGSDDEIFMAHKTSTGISSVPDQGQMMVLGAFPNPFNPSTEIVFATTGQEAIGIRIFDLGGRLVADLGQRQYGPGQHAMTWAGRNDAGRKVPSGVYLYQVSGARETRVGKMMLVE